MSVSDTRRSLTRESQQSAGFGQSKPARRSRRCKAIHWYETAGCFLKPRTPGAERSEMAALRGMSQKDFAFELSLQTNLKSASTAIVHVCARLFLE